MKCDCCGSDAATRSDILVLPLSLGGRDVSSNRVHACPSCTVKIRGVRYTASALIRRGHEKAKAMGVKFGRPMRISERQKAEMRDLRVTGMSYPKIAAALNVSVSTVWNVCKDIDPGAPVAQGEAS